jgi:hypothetical protein
MNCTRHEQKLTSQRTKNRQRVANASVAQVTTATKVATISAICR